MTRCKALEHVGSLNVVASDYRPKCDRNGNFYPLQVSLCLFLFLFVRLSDCTLLFVFCSYLPMFYV